MSDNKVFSVWAQYLGCLCICSSEETARAYGSACLDENSSKHAEYRPIEVRVSEFDKPGFKTIAWGGCATDFKLVDFKVRSY